MSWLAKIEQACADFIERSFAKTFPSDVEPAQIARRLVATMEARTRTENGRSVAPNRYTVYVHPDEFVRLNEHRVYLEREWAALLREMSERVDVTILGSGPRVRLAQRDDVPFGSLDVEATGLDPTVEIDLPENSPHSSASYRLRMIEGVPEYGIYAVVEHTRIGRHEESEVFLVDLSVSRNHATIDLSSDGATLRDCGSTNGCFVNGTKVSDRLLVSGDEIMIGKTRMRFEGDRA